MKGDGERRHLQPQAGNAKRKPRKRPPEAEVLRQLALVAELAERIRASGKTRLDLLGEFGRQERGNSYKELGKAANRFKQTLHQVKQGGLNKGSRLLDLEDFLTFMRRKQGETHGRRT